MYEGDTPNAERRAAALALDRDLLRELLGQEELRELIDPEALEEVEAQLQHRTEAGRAGDRDALQQLLRNLGDLTAAECEERVTEGYSAASMLEKLVAERRVAKVRDRRRGALHRRRGRRPLPRRARGAAAGRAAGDLPRGPPRRDARPGPPLRPHPRPLPDRRAWPSATASTPARPARARGEGAMVRGELLPRRDRARVVRLRSPAPGPPRQPRPPAQGGRGRRHHRSWPASCRAGRTSTPSAAPAPAPTACARRWCRCRASP